MFAHKLLEHNKMEATILMASVLVSFVVLIYSRYIGFRQRRQRLYELASQLPGLPQLPVIGHLHRFIGNTEDIFKTLHELSNFAIDQGGIAKLWINHILHCMISDPADIDYVLKTCLEKDDYFVKFFSGITFAPVSTWRRRRKIMNPGFNPKNLDRFFKTWCEKKQILCQKLNSKVGSGAFDLWPLISAYNLDSMFETVLGEQAAKATSDDYDNLLNSMGELLRLVSKRLFQPWLHPDWMYRLTPYYQSYKKWNAFAFSYTYDVINATRKQLEEEKSVVDNDEEDEKKTWKSFLSFLITQSSKTQGYSNVELREELMALTTGGTDTTAVGSCFTMLLLARHQDIQDKVYQELLDVFGETDRPLLKEDLPKLVYLERVIKEALRLYPPGPFINRQAHKEVTLPSGKVLPAGCGIIISIFGVHRNPKYWGADAELFQPDRFSPERYKPEHPCVYLPFSAGPRNCIGYQYAMMFMKASLATVLRRYRVRVPDGTSSSRIRLKYEIMVKAVDGYNVIVEKRSTIRH